MVKARYLVLTLGMGILLTGSSVLPAFAGGEVQTVQTEAMTPVTTKSFGEPAGENIHLKFPEAPVADLYAGLLKIMKQGSVLSFSDRYEELYPVIEEAYNMPYIASLTVGVAFNTLPSEQKKQLVALLTAYTTASYVANFNSYNDEKFLFGEVAGAGNERIVQTEIASGTQNYTMNYLVMLTADGWKIVDVLMNGTISQLALQRSEFSSLVAAGDASPLIKALIQKISSLSGGTVQVG